MLRETFTNPFHLSGDDVDGCGKKRDGKSPENPSEVLLWWSALHEMEAGVVDGQGIDPHLSRQKKLTKDQRLFPRSRTPLEGRFLGVSQPRQLP